MLRPGVRHLLEPLLAHPDRAAVTCDVDGTIAAIAARAEDARVPAATREVLSALSERYALVACLSGRRALDARRLVGIESLTYIGNHGLERLDPFAERPRTPAAVDQEAPKVRSFATDAYAPRLRQAGIRLEDKHAIFAFHWREAPDEQAARALLEEAAERAQAAGLRTHWGRKVLEVRPALAFDKGSALTDVLAGAGLEAILYAGDDVTDVDAFHALRVLARRGEIEHAVCVGIESDEGPAAIRAEADLLVEGPEGFQSLLSELAS